MVIYYLLINILSTKNNNKVNVSVKQLFWLLTVKWDYAEQSDLMIVFKHMVLGGIKKDNYKELSKRMNEMGWNRSNDMCRHEVQSSLFCDQDSKQ